ncbi:MAG: LamG-like jellyroll fold domain-containing protein [Patescibacteria group bacterium]
MKIVNCKIENSRAWNARAGQSLVEVLVGLSIGAIMIGAATIAISSILRSNVGIEKNQSASMLGQEIIDKTNSWSGESWQNLYGLTKGTSTQYYLNASGSTLFVINGKEGVLDNDVTNGLVGEWKFDEVQTSTSTTTYDATGNNNHGTLSGGPTRASSTCKIANCLSFDGINDYVTIGDINNLDASTAFTVSAWVNRQGDSVSGGAGTIAGKWNTAGASGWFIEVMDSGDANPNAFRFFVSGVSDTSLYATTTFSNSTWYNISAVYDGSNKYIYINGVATSELTTGTPTTTNDPFQIGFNTGSGDGNNYMNGLIDDVRVYNRALSADDVKRLHNNRIFMRWFSVENTCRTTDSSSTISGVSPCDAGSSDDPSTQKVTATVEWDSGAVTTQSSLVGFVTRWKNAIFRQTNWTSGVDASGTYTDSTNYYSSSSNVNTTSSSGSIKLQGI